MKSKKILLSVLGVAVLCAALLGILFTGAAAEENVVLYAVGDLEVQGALQADSIQDALAELEKNSRKWDANTTAEIRIQGNDHSGGAQDGVLFSQATIWRKDGSKLPIKILGVDTANSRDAYIYLDSAGGWYACANDYTFENLTLPVAAQETYFYAGSGDVKLVNCNFNTSGQLTVRTVADRTATYLNAKAVAEYIVADAANLIIPDVKRLPTGEAWYKVRTSEDYYALGEVKTDANGDTYVDMDLTGKTGSAYGDYSHAGDTGGGQYLSACVYYEVLFGLECKDNPWRPTKYNLDETLVPILQKAAHDAVVEVYGESYFDTPQEMDIVGDDGVVNLLMVGSSSSYYMRDELHFLAAEIGVKLRIVHAYSSGIKMSTQWSWAQNGTSTWSVYTEWDGKTSGPVSQNFTQFVNQQPWDIIVTYQTGNALNRKGLKMDGYSEETVAKAIAGCDKADEFINYLYSYNNNANAGARYYWFQVVGGPVGAPGPSSDALGYFYGDNCTEAVYAGWTAADIARYSENGKLSSSITFGKGTQHSGGKTSAVGYMSTAPETAFTADTAKNAKFLESAGLNGYEIPEVLPVDTQGKIIVDGGTVTDIGVHMGFSPASAVYHVKSGSSGSITTCKKNATPRYGDVSICVTGGTIDQVDALREGHLVGDLSFYMDESDGEAVISGMLRMGFDSTHTVSGDVIVDVRGGDIKGTVYSGGQAGGTVYNYYSNCVITGEYFAMRSGHVNRVINVFKNCELKTNYYGGHWDKHSIGVIENHLDGVTIGGKFYGGSYNNSVATTVTGGKITIDGKEETLAIYNDIKNTTVAESYYGSTRAGVAGMVRNDITNLTVDGIYYGSGVGVTEKSSYGDVINNIHSGVFNGIYYGGSQSYKADTTVGNIVNNISGGTFNDAFYGSGISGKCGTVRNDISGGTFNGTFYGANKGNDGASTVGNVTTTVTGGTFNGTYFGSTEGVVSGVKIGDVVNNIHGGTFKKGYYGASKIRTTNSVTNNISGGVFENPTETITVKDDKGKDVQKTLSLYAFYGGSEGGPITKNVVNNISGGDFKCHVILGSQYKMTGSVINNISGGTFALTSCGAGKGEIAGNVENTISGTADFKKGFYCGYGLKESSATKITGNIINKVQPGPTEKLPYFGRAPEYYLSKDGTVDSFNTVGNSDFGYMGGGNNSTISGYVENEISGGYFNGHWHGANNNGSVKGKNADGDGIVNKISGGTFAYRAYGGMVSPTTLTGNLRNEITGGLFKYEFAASHRAGGKTLTTTTYSHDIYTHISGDPVFEKYVCGVARGWNTEQSARVRLLGEAVLTIEGGTFKGDIYGICNNGGYYSAAMPGTRIDDGGSVTVNINGGTFSGEIFATSPTFDATLYHENGLATVKIAPTKGDVTLQKAVASRFANEIIQIGGGDKKLVLASIAAITASSYDGKALNLHRADGWTKGTTYLTLPTSETNANITATKGESAKGDLKTVVNGTETRWIGMDSTGIYGVNLILEQKIALRLWLNKAEVDAIGEDFTYAITCDGKTLAGGTYSDLTAKAEVKKQGETDYYTLVLGGLEPASFHKVILFGGDGLDPVSYSINDILSIVIDNENSAFNEGFVTLAKSLWNYGIEAYNRFSGETSALTKEAISAPTDANVVASATDGNVSDAKIVGRALVLREAVGLRVYLNLQNGIKAEDLTFTLNGTELSKELLHVREESGNGYNASVTVYVSAAAMNRTLNLSITKGDEKVGSYSDSIASICQQYRTANGVDADLCTAILRYIQAVPGMND